MTSKEWNFQKDINNVKSTCLLIHSEINEVTFKVDIIRLISTEWHQQSDLHRCTVWPWLLLPPDSVRYDFLPFTCRQWVSTSMIKTGHTTMTAALSKTERSILHEYNSTLYSVSLLCAVYLFSKDLVGYGNCRGFYRNYDNSWWILYPGIEYCLGTTI